MRNVYRLRHSWGSIQWPARIVPLAHSNRIRRTFEGLPKPDVVNCPADKGVKSYTQPLLAVSKDDVENNFKKYDLLDEQVVFLVGWFKDTLPDAPIDRLSILRLDGDMYGSTMDVLVNLYPKLSIGGFCIIDDYALKGCEKAVEMQLRWIRHADE